MGAAQSAPRLLKLLAADVAKTKNAPFTKARFTWITEQGKQERWIVVSCGMYSVRPASALGSHSCVRRSLICVCETLIRVCRP